MLSDSSASSSALKPPERQGGDPACWIANVCPDCGAYVDDLTLGVCPRCGAALPAEE